MGWNSTANQLNTFYLELGGIQFFNRNFLPREFPPAPGSWNLVDWEAAKLAKNMDAPVVEAAPEEVELKLNRWAKLPRLPILSYTQRVN